MVGASEGEDGVVVCEDVGLGDGEFEVEDVEELTLDAADVALAEDPRAQRPVNVLKRGIVRGCWVLLARAARCGRAVVQIGRAHV